MSRVPIHRLFAQTTSSDILARQPRGRYRSPRPSIIAGGVTQSQTPHRSNLSFGYLPKSIGIIGAHPIPSLETCMRKSTSRAPILDASSAAKTADTALHDSCVFLPVFLANPSTLALRREKAANATIPSRLPTQSTYQQHRKRPDYRDYSLPKIVGNYLDVPQS